MALSGTVPEINEAIAGWEKLAREQDDAAAYEEGRGAFAGVHKNRAELYRRTAESLRLELATGDWHCACCLKRRGHGLGGRS